jgi:hypothetical protein
MKGNGNGGEELRRILAMARVYWPGVRFYREQQETIQAVTESIETLVVAGNELGKDFVAAFISLSFFLCPQMYFDEDYVRQVEERRRGDEPEHLVHTRRVVTTSVREKHLDVLWGEMGKYLSLSAIPLLESRGGELVVNSLDIRFKSEREVKKPFNYLIGCVSGDTGEGLAGHHAAYTLFVGDEVSGLSDTAYSMGQGWAKRMLLFGNPNPCSNFFRRGVKAGNLMADAVQPATSDVLLTVG